MYRLLWCIIPCMVANIYSAKAQCTHTLKVSEVEKHNFAPVYPALVYIEQLHKLYDVDEQGNVRIDSMCAGSYTFHIETAGHEHAVEHITVNASANIRFKVSLLEHNLAEVHVVEEKNKTIQQSKEALGKEKLNAASGKSIGEMLQAINGVSTLGNGATIVKPVIHGMHSNRILMLNNGIRQEDQQWGGEHAPNIDPFLASNITVIKGAAGVRYGTDAMGGVVLVEPPSLRTRPGWDAELNLAGFSNNRMGVGSAMVQHAFKQVPGLAFRVQGTYKKGGNYRIPGYWVANTGVKETNFSGALGYRSAHYGAEAFFSFFNTDLGLYKGSHTGNQNDLENAINSPVPLVPAEFTYDIERPRQHVQHMLGKAKLYADTRIGMWNLVYAYQRNYRQEYDIVRVDKGNAQLNLSLNTHTVNLNLDHRKMGNLEGSIGVDAISQQNYLGNGDRIFIPNYLMYGAAAYLVERYKIGKTSLEAGLRYDNRYFDVNNPEGSNQQVVNYKYNFSNISGTLGIRRHVNDKLELSLTAGRAWRAPQASEMFSAGLHQGAARIEIGNKTLKAESSFNLNAETKYSGQKLAAEVSLYTQYIGNYIYLEPGADLLTIKGYFKTFNYKQTDAMLSGADATVAYLWSKTLSSTVKASLLYARDVTKKDWLILMPPNKYSLDIKYTRSLSQTLRDCYAAVNGRYVARQKRIPANFDAIDHPRPPKEYFLVDASIGTSLQLKKQKVNVSLSVDNVLNAKYRDYLDAFRYFIDQPGRNIVLRLNIPLTFNDQKTEE